MCRIGPANRKNGFHRGNGGGVGEWTGATGLKRGSANIENSASPPGAGSVGLKFAAEGASVDITVACPPG